MTEEIAAPPEHNQADNANNHEQEYCFQLKGGLMPMTVMELYSYDYKAFNQRLKKLVKQAPSFFKDMPIVLNLEKLDEGHESIDFIELTDICQAFSIYPIAIKGGDESQQTASLIAGLPQIPTQKIPPSKQSTKPTNRSAAEYTQTTQVSQDQHPKTDPPLLTEVQKQKPNNKIVTQAIRSGQQVYAPEGDLIILAAVSPGAEILADGNIHVYGPLRGRALAGIKGDTSARIFCQRLEAELLSIAGRYKVDEDLKQTQWKKPAQTALVGDQLQISCLP